MGSPATPAAPSDPNTATPIDRATLPSALPPLDLGVQLATQDLTELIQQLDPTLSPPQRSLLHQIRLAAESLGGMRAVMLTRIRVMPSP